MRTAARIVLTWVLALALPSQGVAAATHCVPSPHSPAEAHAHQDGAAMRDHSLRGDSAALKDAEAGQGVGGSAAPEEGAPGAASAHHGVSKSGCSACAACCTGTALLAAQPVVAPVGPAKFIAPLVPCPPAVFLSGGLERPPRFFLA